MRRLEPTSGPFPCKTAPKLELLDLRGARRVARKRALALTASCDEDCAVAAGGSIVVKGGARGSRKRIIQGTAGQADLELGQPGVVRVAFSKKQAKRLRTALAAGRRAVARVEVTASGGGGGTVTLARRVKQKR